MAISLPELAKIDYTALDFASIIDRIREIIEDHPDYFLDIDDFLTSNASRMTVELVAYVVDLLVERLDWMANELTLPTATQKQSVMNLLKLINYSLTLPTAAEVTVSTTISQWIDPFVMPVRYTVPGRSLDGDVYNFELLMKDENGEYIYEGVGSQYEFDTGLEAAPELTKHDLVFYEGTSVSEFFEMEGIDNEIRELSRTGVEEDSIRIWKVSRDIDGNILSRQELVEVNSFIDPEAQAAINPPFKVLSTEEDGAEILFPEAAVAEIFQPFDEILVWYRVTNGQAGNIAKRAINYSTNLVLSGTSVRATFINNTAGSGGATSETMEHARRNAPLRLTTAEKTVTPNDFTILLQEMPNIINSVAYGKSNEPAAIYEEFGYRIPTFEAWIYPLFAKTGWSSFPTYSYPMMMRVERPYTRYGPLDYELVTFDTNTKVLSKIKNYSYEASTANIMVTDLTGKTIYSQSVGSVLNDYVIALNSRAIVRVTAGAIAENQTVIVQYFENEFISNEIVVNFATGDTQNIEETPIYPGDTTYAKSIDFMTTYVENDVSTNDFNYPTGDYYIDYNAGTIVRNSPWPKLDSYTTVGSTMLIKQAQNNEFILALDGLNAVAYNADHDFYIDAFGGWATIGTGSNVTLIDGVTYNFKVQVDSGEFVNYQITNQTPGFDETVTTHELAKRINTIINGSGAECFAWPDPTGTSFIVRFHSLTRGVASAIDLDDGDTDSLFDRPYITLETKTTGVGEEIEIIELARRCRAQLNVMGLCSGYQGDELELGLRDYPAVYSKANLQNVSSFNFIAASEDTIEIYLYGTTSSDGANSVTFTTATTNGPYDLDIMQERLDLIRHMQTDIDNGIGLQDVVEVFMLRTDDDFYRIGFRLVDVTTSDAYVQINNGSSNNGRILLQISNGQSSTDDNLVEAKVHPDSNMSIDNMLRIELLGAMGGNAFIQSKANNALHNNTLDLLKYGDNQYKYGSSILANTLMSEHDLLKDSSGKYTVLNSGSDQNDRFNLTVTASPIEVDEDVDYVVTIASGSYNIVQLVDAINTAFVSGVEKEGTPTDISSFLVCEKVEGEDRIRIRMLDFNDSFEPDVEINTEDDTTINTKCIDLLGYNINQAMSDYSNINLHYSGSWISDTTADSSGERAVLNHLENNKLICQDYIIKDIDLTTFDVKGTVYCSRGFDRSVIEESVTADLQEAYKADNRDFSDSSVISNITDIIQQTEGTEYVNIEYFGKDYQLYELYQEQSKNAVVTATSPADYVVARWDTKSSFKMTLDGCTVNDVNYDGEYIVVIGNSWADRDYDSLVAAIESALQDAIPLRMGKSNTNVLPALNISHSSGIITIQSVNEGERVLIELEHPEKLFTYGYQTIDYTSDLLESGYAASTDYYVRINVDGSMAEYFITSPASGVWSLSQIADALDDKLVAAVAGATAGISSNGKINVTSLSGGNQSTIDISSGVSGDDLLSLFSVSLDSPVDGTSGYISCLGTGDAKLSIEPVEQYGVPDEPSLAEREEMYNYKTEMPADYDEILVLSDNYYLGDVETIAAQKHGLILEYVEVRAERSES
jgi:hypothetical protein